PAFAAAWCAIPKVVFSGTLDSVQGNARLAEASVAEEAAAALATTDKDVSIGGAGLAAAAIELGLVDELRMFRNPVVVGGGTPFLPPVAEDVPLGDRGARARAIRPELPARPARLSLSVRPHAQEARGGVRGTARERADEGRRRDRRAQGMGRGARPARYVARLRGRAGGRRDPRHRRAQSRRRSARRRRRPAR